jgi:hypothetical protein
MINSSALSLSFVLQSVNLPGRTHAVKGDFLSTVSLASFAASLAFALN